MKWTQLILIFTGKLNYREKVLLRMQNVHTQLLEYLLFSPFGNNFIKTIIKASQTKNSLEIVNDQWGKPTYGLDLARALLSRIEQLIYLSMKLTIMHKDLRQIGLDSIKSYRFHRCRL